MEVHLCDFCKEIIHRKFYALAIAEYDMRKLIEEDNRKRITTMEDFFGELNKFTPRVKKYEICEECYKLYDHFLTMRKEELLDIRNKVQNLLTFKPKRRRGNKNEEEKEL